MFSPDVHVQPITEANVNSRENKEIIDALLQTKPRVQSAIINSSHLRDTPPNSEVRPGEKDLITESKSAVLGKKESAEAFEPPASKPQKVDLLLRSIERVAVESSQKRSMQSEDLSLGSATKGDVIENNRERAESTTSGDLNATEDENDNKNVKLPSTKGTLSEQDEEQCAQEPHGTPTSISLKSLGHSVPEAPQLPVIHSSNPPYFTGISRLAEDFSRCLLSTSESASWTLLHPIDIGQTSSSTHQDNSQKVEQHGLQNLEIGPGRSNVGSVESFYPIFGEGSHLSSSHDHAENRIGDPVVASTDQHTHESGAEAKPDIISISDHPEQSRSGEYSKIKGCVSGVYARPIGFPACNTVTPDDNNSGKGTSSPKADILPTQAHEDFNSTAYWNRIVPRIRTGEYLRTIPDEKDGVCELWQVIEELMISHQYECKHLFKPLMFASLGAKDAQRFYDLQDHWYQMYWRRGKGRELWFPRGYVTFNGQSQLVKWGEDNIHDRAEKRRLRCGTPSPPDPNLVEEVDDPRSLPMGKRPVGWEEEVAAHRHERYNKAMGLGPVSLENWSPKPVKPTTPRHRSEILCEFLESMSLAPDDYQNPGLPKLVLISLRVLEDSVAKTHPVIYTTRSKRALEESDVKLFLPDGPGKYARWTLEPNDPLGWIMVSKVEEILDRTKGRWRMILDQAADHIAVEFQRT